MIEAFGARWDETLGPAIEGSVEILRELLDAGHRCYALSNWNAETFASIEDRYPFLVWFDGLVISGREGVIKPDPAIYRLLCDRHGIEPDEAVFVDDSPTNVAAAVALGFDGIVFTDPDQLRRRPSAAADCRLAEAHRPPSHRSIAARAFRSD